MWKYVRIGLIAFAVIYAGAIIVGLLRGHDAAQDGSTSGNPNPQAATNGDLDRLQAEKARLNTLLAQCVQITVGAAQSGAFGTAPPSSQMTPQYCDQMTPQWYSQLSVVDAQISRLQGVAANPCSVSGACNPSNSGGAPSGSSSAQDSGQTPAERYSEQGILGQKHYAGTDGSDLGNDYVLPTQHDYYYRNPATGDIVGTDIDQTPDADHTERLTPK